MREVPTREGSIRQYSTEEWSTDEVSTDNVFTESPDESPLLQHPNLRLDPFQDADDFFGELARELLFSDRHFNETIERSIHSRGIQDYPNDDLASTLFHSGNVGPSILPSDEEMLSSTFRASTIVMSEFEGTSSTRDHDFLEEIGIEPPSSTNSALPLEDQFNILVFPVSSSKARGEMVESWRFPQAVEAPEALTRIGDMGTAEALTGVGSTSPQLAIRQLPAFPARQGLGSTRETQSENTLSLAETVSLFRRTDDIQLPVSPKMRFVIIL